MPLEGTLNTMPLPDLLQWLESATKSGGLIVERNKVSRTIQLSRGRIVGCSSDDPPQRLGHYLLSRGKISEPQLREALAEQERSAEHLGRILVRNGVLTQEDLSAHLASKAEETIYSLFDCEDAQFRFDETLDSPAGVFPVDLQVQDVLLRGLKRYDEMKRVRQVFHDPGIVLRYTEKPPPPEVFGNRMARTLYATIDGERTIADILLQVHGSEYVVYKFLFELHRNGYVEISHVKAVPARGAPSPALAAAAAAGAPAALGHAAGVAAPAARIAASAPTTTRSDAERSSLAVAPLDLDEEALGEIGAPGGGGSPASPGSPGVSPTGSLEERLAEARRLLAAASYDAALDLLDLLYRDHPSDDALRRLTVDAEAAFLDKAYRHAVPPDKIPVLTLDLDQLESEKLSPPEFFLISRIDGTWDVKSIIQIAPLREVEAVRILKRMREKGTIKLEDRR